MKQLNDGIDNVIVTLDKPDSTFKVGSPMTGNIMVICEQTTAIRAIRLKVFGRMNIYWKKIEGGSTYEYAEIEDYLDEEINVWTPNLKKREDMWMFPGHHTYPFAFDLPIDLPDTLEDSRYAKVSYFVKASVYMTQQRVSHSLEEPFYIITIPDNSVPKPAEEDMPKENCSYAVIGGTCFMQKTYVELFMRLEKNIYRLGEKIPVHVEVRTEGGTNEIQQVTALLVQEAIYKVNIHTKEETRKKERLVFDEAEDEGNASGSKSYDLELHIDDALPLTDYPWCDFIEMAYFVHVVARTHSFYDDVVVKLPIIVNPKDDDVLEISAPDEVVLEENEEEEEEEGASDNDDEDSNEEDEEGKDKSEEEKGDDQNKDKDDEIDDLLELTNEE